MPAASTPRPSSSFPLNRKGLACESSQISQGQAIYWPITGSLAPSQPGQPWSQGLNCLPPTSAARPLPCCLAGVTLEPTCTDLTAGLGCMPGSCRASAFVSRRNQPHARGPCPSRRHLLCDLLVTQDPRSACHLGPGPGPLQVLPVPWHRGWRAGRSAPEGPEAGATSRVRCQDPRPTSAVSFVDLSASLSSPVK